MLCYKILNSLGLILGLIGVMFIFFWGPPQPNLEIGIGIGLEDNTPIDKSGKTVKEHNDETKTKRKFYNKMSRLGLAFIFIGFLIQLISTWF